MESKLNDEHGSNSDSNHSESRSASGSRSRSITPKTPAAAQIRRKSGSETERSVSGSGRSSKSRSRSGSQSGGSQSGSRSRSSSRNSRHSGSARSRRSRSANSRRSGSAGSRRSDIKSKTNKQSVSRSQSGSPKQLSKGPQWPLNEEDSRSQSPNLQIDDERSRGSGSTRSHSGRSRSGTPAKGDKKPRSRSGSESRKSRSSSRSITRSRSGTPQSRSGSESDAEIDSKKNKGKRKALSSDSESESNKKKADAKKDIVQRPKKPRIIDSESETEEPAKKVDAQDIFGDADDISVSENDEKKSDLASEVGSTKSRSRSKSMSSRASSLRSRSVSESQPHEERGGLPKEDEPEPIPETCIDVEIPRIVTDLGKEIHFVKLPNFLSVETRPFDQETYEDEIDEEETMDEEGRQRIKLKVSNTIRWREFMDNEGNMVKESNARFVRWSDGSMTLNLGNETFDVYKQPLHGDHNHMFIRQGTGLQGQAVFRTKLTFRPHSTESFTHKKMTMSLADRSQKTSGIKILTQVGKDPTQDRLYNLKKEEEKLRQAMRSQHKTQPKKKKTSAHDLHGTRSSYNADDGSDDDNAISLSAIKNKYKKGAGSSGLSSLMGSGEQKASAIYSSDDDDDSDFEGRRSKKHVDKVKVVKALKESDSESDEVEDDKQNDGHSEKLQDEGSDEVEV